MEHYGPFEPPKAYSTEEKLRHENSKLLAERDGFHEMIGVLEETEKERDAWKQRAFDARDTKRAMETECEKALALVEALRKILENALHYEWCEAGTRGLPSAPATLTMYRCQAREAIALPAPEALEKLRAQERAAGMQRTWLTPNPGVMCPNQHRCCDPNSEQGDTFHGCGSPQCCTEHKEIRARMEADV